ncbi:MAG: hypothetical protein QOI63_2064 [Thermoplasmata archaeon]|nr:hypothetical protein [Thermoplasmata archaeon]
MAKKTTQRMVRTAQAPRAAYGKPEPPLHPDALASLRDQPAAQPVPRQVAQRLKTPNLRLSARGDLARHLEPVSRDEGQWVVDAKVAPVVGVVSRDAKRLERKAPAGRALGPPATPGFRPPWADLRFAPSAPPPRPAPLRRRGRAVTLHHEVFGAEDRRTYYPSGYPWNCIGRLSIWTDPAAPDPQFTASGALVGPKHVLTAGHCVPWGKSWKMQFVPGYYQGSSVAGAGASSWVSQARGWNDPGSAHDMAVLHLTESLGDWLGYMGTKTYQSRWEDHPYWTLAGYPDAVGGTEMPARQSRISVLDDDSDGSATKLEHEGDATEGESGGPFFGWWPDHMPYAIGTDSGGEDTFWEDDNFEAGGRAMVDLVQWARDNWK